MEDLLANYANEEEDDATDTTNGIQETHESTQHTDELIGPQLPFKDIEENDGPEKKRQKTSEQEVSARNAFPVPVRRYLSKKEKELQRLETNATRPITEKHEQIDLFELPSRIKSIVDSETDTNVAVPQGVSLTLQGHTNGVNCIRWSNPNSSFIVVGHLTSDFFQLLTSASTDHTVKLWDVFRTKKCVITFAEHEGAVRDIQWNWDGTHLISASYDKTVRLYDVETAKCVQSYKHKEFVTSICYHPSNHNLFLAGGFKNGIACWDTLSNSVVTQYNGVFGQVQGLEFINNGKYFISTSDVTKRNSIDKAIIIWDFDSSAPISNQVYLEAFTCPSVKAHPDKKHFIAQSNGNYIAIFSTEPPFKLNKHKRFEGHKVAGYHIKCNISADGSMVATGSADGRIHLYNWYSSNTIRVLKGHKKSCMEASFHPVLHSTIASCGWDNNILIFE